MLQAASTLPSTAQVPLGQDATPTEVDLFYTDGNTSFPALTFGNGQWGVRRIYSCAAPSDQGIKPPIAKRPEFVEYS